jgi:RecJ-like exonuclease
MREELTKAEKEELKRLRAAFKKRFAERGPRPETPQGEVCDFCKGKGKGKGVQCPRCNGKGRIDV